MADSADRATAWSTAFRSSFGQGQPGQRGPARAARTAAKADREGAAAARRAAPCAQYVPAGSGGQNRRDRKSTRLNSSHVRISYAVFCLKKQKSNLAADDSLFNKHLRVVLSCG